MARYGLKWQKVHIGISRHLKYVLVAWLLVLLHWTSDSLKMCFIFNFIDINICTLATGVFIVSVMAHSAD